MTDKPTVGRIEFGPPVPNESEFRAMQAQAYPDILCRREDGAVFNPKEQLGAGDEVLRLRALLAEARAVIEPLTRLELVAVDGGKYGHSSIMHVGLDLIDLARARKFMKDSADANNRV